MLSPPSREVYLDRRLLHHKVSDLSDLRPPLSQTRLVTVLNIPFVDPLLILIVLVAKTSSDDREGSEVQYPLTNTCK